MVESADSGPAKQSTWFNNADERAAIEHSGIKGSG